jgi:hypothetical protein
MRARCAGFRRPRYLARPSRRSSPSCQAAASRASYLAKDPLHTGIEVDAHLVGKDGQCEERVAHLDRTLARAHAGLALQGGGDLAQFLAQARQDLELTSIVVVLADPGVDPVLQFSERGEHCVHPALGSVAVYSFWITYFGFATLIAL